MYISKYMYKIPYDGHLKNIKATILRQAVNSTAKKCPRYGAAICEAEWCGPFIRYH